MLDQSQYLFTHDSSHILASFPCTYLLSPLHLQTRQSKATLSSPSIQKAPPQQPVPPIPQAPTIPERTTYRQSKLPSLYTPSANRQAPYSAQKAASLKAESDVSQARVQPLSSYAGLSKQRAQPLWNRGSTKVGDIDDEDEMEVDVTARRKRVSPLRQLCLRSSCVLLFESLVVLRCLARKLSARRRHLQMCFQAPSKFQRVSKEEKIRNSLTRLLKRNCFPKQATLTSDSSQISSSLGR